MWGWDHSPAIDPILHDHPHNGGEAMDMDDNDAEEIRDAHNASGKMGDARYWIEAQDPVGDSESLQPLILGRLVVW